jgi:hypothetical protein
MTANEKRLLKIFLAIAFGAVLVPLGYLEWDRVGKAERSIDSYMTALSKIERFDQDLGVIDKRIEQLKATLGNEPSVRTGSSFSDFASEARALLNRYGIEPKRYQVVGAGEETSVEFTLRCDTIALMKFLRDASGKDRSWAMPLVSLHPEAKGRAVNATIRIRYAK